MLEEKAIVMRRQDQQIWVETQARSSCSQCTSSGCTTSVVSKLFGVRRNLLALENTLGARVGDRVVIGIPDRLLVKASVWAYLAPLVCLIGAVMFAASAGFSDLVQVLFALAGLAGGFLGVNRILRFSGRARQFSPLLLRIDGHVVIAEPVFSKAM